MFISQDRWRRCVAEFVGTAFLLAVIVGSGIMGDRLAGGTVALALLANSLATGAALVALILALGPISGAHFNPVVSAAAASQGRLSPGDLMAYVPPQVLGAFLGTACTDAMFGEPALAWSTRTQAFLKLSAKWWRRGSRALGHESHAGIGIHRPVLRPNRQASGLGQHPAS